MAEEEKKEEEITIEFAGSEDIFNPFDDDDLDDSLPEIDW